MKFSDVLEIKNGRNQKQVENPNGKYPIYGSGGIMGFADDYICEPHTVIIGRKGTINNPIYVETPFWNVDTAFGLQAKKDILHPKYLYYFCVNFDFEALNTTVTIPSLTKANLLNIDIPLPPITEQNEIVDTLTSVDELIQIKKQQLELFDELVKSRFIELFGDGRDGKTPVKMLGSICKFQQGTQIPVGEQFEEQKAGYKRFLRIIDYTQAPQPPRYVNANGKEVDEKSVVIVRYGATAGFVGRGYQGILANNLFEVMPDETILSKDFLFLALKYGTFEKEVHDKAFGAAMPALSFTMMNDISVVVPVAEEQKKFVSFVEQTDKSKSAIQQSLEKLETLKAALMQKYFG